MCPVNKNEERKKKKEKKAFLIVANRVGGKSPLVSACKGRYASLVIAMIAYNYKSLSQMSNELWITLLFESSLYS